MTNDKFYELMILNLDAIMRYKAMSPSMLERKAGVSKSTVTKAMTKGDIKAKELFLIAEYLGVNVIDLVKEDLREQYVIKPTVNQIWKNRRGACGKIVLVYDNYVVISTDDQVCPQVLRLDKFLYAFAFVSWS